VKSSLETLEGNKVKLYVEVEEAEFDRDIDRAFKAIAREVRLPGFRNGKAPRRVLEARIGIAPAREQALREAIPSYLAKAVREHDVDLVATPEIEVTGGTEEGPVEFDATCEVRPEVSVPGYGGLRVELPALHATDDEVDEAIDAERRRQGVPTAVDRPAAVGDLVTLDLVTERDGEEVSGLNTEDWSYEIGQGWITDDFDDQLVGASSGDVLEFTSTPKGTEEPADFTVTVKSVDEMNLPELNDEWVGDNFGEFETVEEWRAAQRERISELKLNQARQQFMGKVSEALTALVDIDAPESMVQSELQGRVQNTVARFQANGIDLQQWLSATGQDTNEFMASMKTQSEQAVKLDLALRAVANAEGFEVADDDLDAEYQRVAMQVGEKVAKVKKAYEQNDAVADLTAQIRKSKALEWLMHNTEVVDTDGNPIDNDELLGHSMDDHDHDHDNDNDHDGAPAVQEEAE
jgi:trigger factor